VVRQQELTAESLWTEVSQRLRETLNQKVYRNWFGSVSGLELTDDTFKLAVPDGYTRGWIDDHFAGLIQTAVEDAVGRGLRLELVVEQPAETATAPEARKPHRAVEGMNPRYTFDSFVIGSSNRFAHAAALAVAEAPAQAYNPLFIYGGTGLGKTHLQQAIGQYVAEHSSSLSVRYVPSETFMNDFIN
jgi:chromosomal replication initiator protein